MEFEKFLGLPTHEVARLVQEAGPVVCVFPITGARRGFLLGYPQGTRSGVYFLAAYLQASIRRQIGLFHLFFEHGIDTLMMPLFDPDLLGRGEADLQMAANVLRQLAVNPAFLHYYQTSGARVRFFGDYRRYLQGQAGEDLADLLDQVTLQTARNDHHRLLFGVFGHNAAETIGEISVRYYQKHRRLPDKRTLVEQYYGEFIPPVSLFIGFDQFSAVDLPLVSTGSEDLYFNLNPSPRLAERQLRTILYDYLYMRRVGQRDCESHAPESVPQLGAFYHKHREISLCRTEVRERFNRFTIPLASSKGPRNVRTS